MPLYTVPDLDALWPGLVQRWFQQTVPGALRHAKPVAVLTPGRQLGYLWRQRWMQEGAALCGVQFWMPKDARAQIGRLLPGLPATVSREEMRFALSLTASELLAESAGEQSPPALLRALAADPAALLSAVDALGSAGWSAAELGDPLLEKILLRTEKRLRAANVTALYEVERQTLEQARTLRAQGAELPLGPLLIAGFDASHWSLWPLLQAAALLSEAPTVILTQPRLATEGSSHVWISSWETVLGEAQPEGAEEAGEAKLGVAAKTPFSALAESMERQAAGEASETFLEPERVQFRIAVHARQLPHILLAQVEEWLTSNAREPLRIGLLFPGPSPLAREVAQALADANLPHNDTLGFRTPHGEGIELWRSWLALQNQARLGPCLELLRSLSPAPVPTEAFETLMNGLYGEVLTDDLRVLHAALEQKLATPKSFYPKQLDCAERTAEWLSSDLLLPPRATLGQFCAATLRWLHESGLPEQAEELQRRVPRLERICGSALLERALYVRWLTEISDRAGRMRHKAGAEPFAPIQILPYAEAEGQQLTHALFVGLSQGEFPPARRSLGLLSEARIVELNQSALQAAASGEGEQCVHPGKGQILSEELSRRAAQQTFIAALAGVREQLCAVASAENTEGKATHPGPLFFDLYGTTLGELPRSSALVEETQTWLAQQPLRMFQSTAPAAADPGAARRAYDARRDVTSGFGPYDFSLLPDTAQTSSKPFSPSCKEWEELFHSPGALWLKCALGCEPVEAFYESDPAQLATGTWVHRWLNLALKAGAPSADDADLAEGWLRFPPQAERATRKLESASEEDLFRAHELYRAVGYTAAPLHWQVLWHQAQAKARSLLKAVCDFQSDWCYARLEFSLPQPLLAPANFPGAGLPLRGRIDLLLSKNPRGIEGHLYVIDFKTGSRKPWTPAQALKGTGFQIVLYSLATQALGARHSSATLLTPDNPMKDNEPLEFELLRPVLNRIASVQQSHCLGWSGEEENERNPAVRPLPLAVLVPDSAICKRRLENTFPELGNTLAADDESDEGEES